MKSKIDKLEIKLNALSRKVGEVTGEHNYLAKSYAEALGRKVAYQANAELYQKSVELLQLVSGVIREKTRKQFEELVSSALQFVFGEGYGFKLEFDRRGNLSTLDFKIVTPEHDEPCNPLDCESGGILDLVSLVLRVVLMETSNPRTKGFIILDESLSKLDKNRLPQAAEFIRQLSEKLNRQIIFISHSDYIINANFNQVEIT